LLKLLLLLLLVLSAASDAIGGSGIARHTLGGRRRILRCPLLKRLLLSAAATGSE
jgi:hypothetical protein